MRLSLLKNGIVADKSDVLLFVASANGDKMTLSSKAADVDKRLGGLINAARKDGFNAKNGDVRNLAVTHGKYQRLILVGRGDKTDAESAFVVADVVAGLKDVESLTIVCEKDPEPVVVAAAAGAYRFRFDKAWPEPAFKHIKVAAAMTPKVFEACSATGEGMRLAKHLAEQPGNVCTPAFLAQTARKMAKLFPALSVRILEKKQMETLKMGALLGVAQGSPTPAKLIVLEYKGGSGAPVALVGKGVTFDTGGISLKPGAAMDEMKFDMCGAAAVLGTVLACARMKLSLNVVGIVPACENMPGGRALKPGDIIRAMDGKTIEVLNTDAEGRLILADALSYAARYKPAATVDIATLTGACVIALGHHISGLMSTDDKLAASLLSAGEIAGDRCWRLPMNEKYDSQLKTDYADVANIGGRAAGTITAACFLGRFAKSKSWAHLDVAGTAWTTKKRASGRPIPLLVRFLMQRAK